MWLDANTTGNINGYDWESATKYRTNEGQQNCVSPKKNCTDADYSCAVVNITTTWEQVTVINGQSFTFTNEDAEDFWDHMYLPLGYEKIGTIDYSMNCHGYAFGVGDWPEDGQYGAELILECWQADDDQCDATVAVTQNGHDHSIKVIGAECNDGYTSWCIHENLIEKYKESALYLKEGDCPGGVNISAVHNNASFDLYKPL